MSSSSRVWLVTGSSSGFGLSICRLALEKGDKVVATLRRPSDIAALAAQYPSDALLVGKVDVTHPKEVVGAFRAAKERFGRVDIVFNNAGFSITGEVEGVPEAEARRLMEVNFWGALAVSKEAVRFFREENPAGMGGTLFNMSSAAGHCGVPSMGYYSAAKHALEGLTEALAMEVDPAWKIKICTLAPGFFRSEISVKSPTLPVHHAYASAQFVVRIRGILDLVADPAKPIPLGDVNKAVNAIYEMSTFEELPLRVFLGRECVDKVREKYRRVGADLDGSDKWSAALLEDQ